MTRAADARFAGPDGQDLVLLADQDRALWDWAADRRGARDPHPDHRQPRSVPDPGRDRLAADGGPHRLAADRGAVRRARRADRVAGGPAQRRDRGRPGRRARPPPSRSSTSSTCPATSTGTRPGRNCCAVSGAPTRRVPPTATRSPSPGPSRSGASCSGGSPSLTEPADPVPASGIPRAVPAQVPRGGGAYRAGERREPAESRGASAASTAGCRSRQATAGRACPRPGRRRPAAREACPSQAQARRPRRSRRWTGPGATTGGPCSTPYRRSCSCCRSSLALKMTVGMAAQSGSPPRRHRSASAGAAAGR